VTWAANFWDVIHDLYWSPQRLGLNRVQAIKNQDDSAFVKVPRRYLLGGEIRYRSKKWNETKLALLRDEKALNCFFDVMFSICPDYLIDRWLCKPLGIEDVSEFRSFSLLHLSERFGWGDDNVTQHDGFFISPNSIVCVEIKLKAQTDINQIIKYAAIVKLEETATGIRDNIGLLYVVPKKRINTIKNKVSIESLSWPVLGEQPGVKLNPKIKTIIESDPSHFDSVLKRLRINIISWSDLYDQVTAEHQQLDPRNSSEQTLYRLLDGFLEQLRAHQDTGIELPAP